MSDSFFSKPKKRSSRNKPVQQAPRKRQRLSKRDEDEEITSESDVSDVQSVQGEDEDEEEEDFFENENEADKRRRLAQDYLDNVKQELEYEGFDAADLDREIIASRLKEDVAEHKGRIYRYLGSRFKGAHPKLCLTKPYAITAIATRYPNAYTVSKDLHLTKWDISKFDPRQVKFVKGRHNRPDEGHSDEILCVAVSGDGKYIATGGKDKRIIVWSPELAIMKIFDTRDRNGVVTGLAFRRGTNELYASCADLKVRTYNLDQLAQVETLFGHQDVVGDIAALGQERCLTVGSRDRTAIMWKISEESRLTFRGADNKQHMAGSIDCCSMIDDQLFVTGSDNGDISLWSLQKKKPVYIKRQAHGLDGSSLPHYITSVYAIPYSDIFFTGSHSGAIKIWKLAENQRGFDSIGEIPVKGIVNRISTVEKGPRNKETFVVYAAVSKEMRLGRWMKHKKGKNGILSAVIQL